MVLALLRRMKIEDVTGRGFRPAFRDWAAERNFPKEVCEAALAHVIENKAEAAYRRGDLLRQYPNSDHEGPFSCRDHR